MSASQPKNKTEKKGTLPDKVTDYLSWFLGSWWAVFFHTFWFSVWLILDFNIDLLTFSVSLEAIFIGIFLLMASNKAERIRDQTAAAQREEDRKRLETDIKLDEKADRQLAEIKKNQKELHREVISIRKTLKKLSPKS